MGLCKESKRVNSAAVKREAIGQGEDEELLEAAEYTRLWSWVTTLNYMSLDRSNVDHAEMDMCTKMANPTRGSGRD